MKRKKRKEACQTAPLYRFRTKFMLACFSLFLVLTVAVDLTVYTVYRQDVEQKETESISRNLAETAKNLRTSVLSLKESITYKTESSGIFDYQSNLGEATGYSVEKKLRTFLELMRSTGVPMQSVYLKDIYSCRFFCDARDPDLPLAQFKDSEAYRYVEDYTEELFRGRGSMKWRWFSDTPNTVYLIKSTVNADNLHFTGVLCMAVDLSYFSDLLGDRNYRVALFDETHDLLFSTEERFLQENLSLSQAEQVAEDRGFLWGQAEIQRENWVLTGFVSEKEVFAALTALMRTIVVVEAAVFLVMALFIILISRSMTHNIGALSENFRRIDEGKQAKRIEPRSNDETAYLCRQFNAMQDALRANAEQMAKDSTLREKAEYNALLAQMNPHFLYNALESMSSMAKLAGQTELTQAIQALGRLLRASISGTEQEIPLCREIDYIRQYLSLQDMVTGGRISWDFVIDPQTENAMVPKLILQPLVENSIIHGLQDVLEEGMIVIAARREGDELVIEVSDNGAGLEQEEADRLLREEKTDEQRRDRAHIGLKSIQKRIRILYGSPYGLELEGAPGSGTAVRLHLPYRGENDNV